MSFVEDAMLSGSGMELHRATVSDVFWLADSYKVSHWKQYPPGTTHVYSYFESRGGKFEETCFFGLQYLLKRWMTGPVVRLDNIAEAKEFYRDHFNQDIFNEEGFKYIAEVHNGYLPLRIKAVPEGTCVPVRNVLFTVENTDPNVPWLTNWFETVLLQCWYPVTVATLSREYKKTIVKYLLETADNLDSLPFKLHDFGYRGASSVESAAIGDAAHLVNFRGTDTIAGLRLCRKFYSCRMAGNSIPATEHSTTTAWGAKGEVDAFRQVLETFPNGMVSVVSDSYDLFNAVDNIWGDQLKSLVDKRGETGGVLVIRPDSGDPIPILIKVLDSLAKKFPISTNTKGYKMLPPHVRLIQGDGINCESTGDILRAMKEAGWSAENVAFGTGGALIQRINRDTQKVAFKCSNVTVNGEDRIVFKDPITDHGKRSKKGRLTLEADDEGHFRTVEEGKGDSSRDQLKTVFENGKLIVDWNFDEIRDRAELDEVKEWRRANGKTNGVH